MTRIRNSMIVRWMCAGFVAALLATTVITAQKPEEAETLLQTAIKKEVVDGDLTGAIEIYKKALAAAKGNRAHAVQALVRMAEAYEKLGNAESRKIYQRIVDDYKDQKEALTTAKRRLDTLAGSTRSLTARQVCAECGGSSYLASLTVDGRTVQPDGDGTGRILIRDLATGKVTQQRIETEPGPNTWAYWADMSPDSRHILYWWWKGDEADTPRNGYQLRLASNPLSKPRILVQQSEEQLWIEPGGWSRDGKSVLVSIQKADSTWQLAWVSLSDGAIKPLKSLEWRLKSRAFLSPDGRYIAYSALATNPKSATGKVELTDQYIYVLDADGSQETELVKTAAINTNPVWAPDGTSLLYTSNGSGAVDLWSMPMRDGKSAGFPSIVKAGIGDIAALGVPSSGSFYYIKGQNEAEQVFVADADAEGKAFQDPKPLYAGLLGHIPTWSPDGKSIAFLRPATRKPRVNPRNPINVWDLVVYSIETKEEKLYPGAGAMEFVPGPAVWFRDGKSFLHAAWDGNPWLYRVDARTGESKPAVPTSLVSRFQQRQRGVLSPDDRTLYLIGLGSEVGGGVSNANRILAYDLATGEQKLIFTASDSQGFLEIALSPDARTLVVAVEEPGRRWLELVSVTGADHRRLWDFPTPPGRRPAQLAWTPDGQFVLMRMMVNGGLWRIPVKGGPREPVSVEAEGRLQHFDLSPDGSRLVFSAVKSTDEIWALDNLAAALKRSK